MIINSFKNKIFPLYLKKRDFEDEDKDKDRDESEDEFYAPKEVTPRIETSHFGIREMFEEKTSRDMPDLETEEFDEQRRNKKGQRFRLPIALLN